MLGALMFVIMIPLRFYLVAVHHYSLGETLRSGARIGVSIAPTLVITLVVAEILRDRFGAPQAVFGGMIVYTLANTLFPGFILRLAPADRSIEDVPVPEMALATPGPVSPQTSQWTASPSPEQGDTGHRSP